MLDQEQVIGEYAVRVWRNENSPSAGLGFDRILTLNQSETSPLLVEFFSGFDALSGADITGDGVPELIVTTYTGGAHCCFSVIAFSLGDTPVKILETRPSNCGGRFQDLNGDGIPEFITCDDVFAYTYCPYAASPLVQVILAYAPDVGYQPAGPRFADRYAAELPSLSAQAAAATPGGLGEWDNTTKCGVLPLVLALLYSGQPAQAWSELDRLYPYPDAALFRQEIEQTVGVSPLFALP
ncbi:MAG: hypothetical protein IT317_06135 [Anaerolineales bacterium]|nr:hypothetical protein [Anaerolineales bacterium]